MPKIVYGKSEVDTLLNNKQNNLTAGAGITITNDVISASGGGGSGMTAHTYSTRGALATDIIANPNGLLVALISARDYTEYPHKVVIGTNVINSNTVRLVLESFITGHVGGSAHLKMYPEDYTDVYKTDDYRTIGFHPIGMDITIGGFGDTGVIEYVDDTAVSIDFDVDDCVYYY